MLQTDTYTLYHGDCLDVMAELAAQSVDAIITDPPYGVGIDAWDVFEPAQIVALTKGIRRVLKPNGFYAVFGQMPSLAEWHNAAKAERLHFCEHITWVKRIATPAHRLTRGHEDIYIYAAGERKSFYTTSGPYEDVKLPGVLVDVITLDGIDRYIKDLRLKVAAGSEERGLFLRGNKGQSQLARRAADSIVNRSAALVNFTNVWSFLPCNHNRRNGTYTHPSEKPMPIMLRLAEMLSAPDALILDPFMGSGTTGVAALQTGRKFIGIEREQSYFDSAVQRLNAAQQAPQQMEWAA